MNQLLFAYLMNLPNWFEHAGISAICFNTRDVETNELTATHFQTDFMLTHSHIWDILFESLPDKDKSVFTEKLLCFKIFEIEKHEVTEVSHSDLGALAVFRNKVVPAWTQRVSPKPFRQKNKDQIRVHCRRHGLEAEDIEFSWTCGCVIMDQHGKLWEHDWSNGGGGVLSSLV